MVARLLFSLLVALGLFVSPVSMASGGGMAMAHSTSIERVEANGHCAGSETPAEEPSDDSKMSCAAACAAFPPMLPATGEEIPLVKLADEMLAHTRLAGIHPEGETPPPRITSEI